MPTPDAKYRHSLPQLGPGLFLTDSGLETELIFHDGIGLPCFASFPLLQSDAGRRRLHEYYSAFARLAVQKRLGLVLETNTWRANADWGANLGYDATALADINRRAVELVLEIRHAFEVPSSPMPISGCVGPRGDGYRPGQLMTNREALDYHDAQIATFAETAVDLVSAFTITNTPEALGIVLAGKRRDIPVAMAFTLETDGRLPTGQPLRDAIAEVDAATGNYASFFMINCAHPTHFDDVLDDGEWTKRLKGVRANASRRSHAELDAASDLDAGDPAELARQYVALRKRLPHVNIVGGCCGTDFRHVEAISECCQVAAP